MNLQAGMGTPVPYVRMSVENHRPGWRSRHNGKCKAAYPVLTHEARLLAVCSKIHQMARPRGFEPLTSAFGGQRSIQLSYGRVPP
jgi:hypothetical protein